MKAPAPEPPATNPMKPVAYDQYGRPLYAHPPTGIATPPQTVEPQVVHMTRSVDPLHQEISPEIQQKHDDSLHKYPHLNISSAEYVISAVHRHPIGLFSIWAVVAAALLIVFVAFPALIAGQGVIGGGLHLSTGAIASAGLVLLLLAILFVLGGIIATVVYQGNRFYLTNESVIQHIQTSLFSKREQTVSLLNIEDASFRQHGILQTLLNYGSLRLSTQGDETTYRFNFVADPQQQVTLLNNAIESFKNFRPIEPDEA